MRRLVWLLLGLAALILVAVAVGSLVPPQTDLETTKVTPAETMLLTYDLKADPAVDPIEKSAAGGNADSLTVPVVLDSLVPEAGGSTSFSIPPLRLLVDVRRTYAANTQEWWLVACMVRVAENDNFEVSVDPHPTLTPHIGSQCGLRFEVRANRIVLAGLFGLGGHVAQTGHAFLTARTDGTCSFGD